VPGRRPGVAAPRRAAQALVIASGQRAGTRAGGPAGLRAVALRRRRADAARRTGRSFRLIA